MICVELRNWTWRRLGAETTVMKIVMADNTRHPGEKIQGKLVEKYIARAR